MPTTTNYGWTTPADTDLVKDGASAIRTLGTAIDTTVFNNAGAAINKTIVDAKGDLIVASGADAVARLAVGTNNHVLTADSAATNGVKWAALPPAGGKTLLSTTTLSGASTTISAIDQTYKDLQIYIQGAYNSTDTDFSLRINGITSSTYSWGQTGQQSATAFGENQDSVAQIRINRIGSSSVWNQQYTAILDIYRYAETTPFTKIFYQTRHYGSGLYWTTIGSGTQSTAGALTSITFFPASGTLSGGTVYIYGVS